MSDLTIQPEVQQPVEPQSGPKLQRDKKPSWETPKLEDVSEQVMAQPYIRFT